MTTGRTEGGDGARLATAAMTPVAFLGRYINMRIIAVRANPKGTVMVVGPIGHMTSRRILIEGITDVTELPSYIPDVKDPDWEQVQTDLGDDHYERERYERQEP